MAKVNRESFDNLEEIWRQTEKDRQIGRISPNGAIDYSLPIPTQRFAISQRSASGKMKIRCIDDFRRSLRNETNLVVGRIRLGRVRDALDVASTLFQQSVRKLGNQRILAILHEAGDAINRL